MSKKSNVVTRSFNLKETDFDRYYVKVLPEVFKQVTGREFQGGSSWKSGDELKKVREAIVAKFSCNL